MKRTLSLVLSLIMTLGIFASVPVTVSAVTSGTCGDNLTWVLDDEGTLTISGTGDMWNWQNEAWDDSGSNPSPFYMDSNIRKIIIHPGVTSVGKDAFSGCLNLTSIAIPNGVTSIGNSAFADCTSLALIVIPDSVTNIGGGFYDTGYYNNASNWENNVLYINNHLIDARTSITGDYVVKDGTKSIADTAFQNCDNLTSITIPDSVTNIGRLVFDGCTSLASITIPDSVTSIGRYAFCGCKNLSAITIPDNVTSIGDGAFEGCTALTYIEVPDGVTNIDVFTFSGCSQLASVVIGNNVKHIDNWAFVRCANLKNVFYSGSLSERNEIEIGFENDCLINATWHYNYKHKPITPKVSGSNTLIGINVSWNSVSRAVKYVVYRRNAGSSTWTAIGTTSGTNIVDKNVISGKYYIYSVRAYNAEGTYSDYDSTKTKSIMYISTPSTSTTNLVNGVQVKWNSVTGATKYNVYRRVGGSSSWVLLGSSTGTSLTDKNVKNGTYYVYSVRAVNGANISLFDTNKTDTIQPVTAPTAVATNLANGVQITWNKSSGATKYNVYRRTAGSSSWVLMGTTTGTSLVDKNVKFGTYYVYSIRAINGTGYSAFDTIKTDTIQPITAPTAKVANKSSGVQVSWNSVSGATKYNVYRRLGGTSTWVYVGQTTGTSFIDTGVVKGKSYAYSIRAINGTGYSAYDSSKCASIKHS